MVAKLEEGTTTVPLDKIALISFVEREPCDGGDRNYILVTLMTGAKVAFAAQRGLSQEQAKELYQAVAKAYEHDTSFDVDAWRPTER